MKENIVILISIVIVLFIYSCNSDKCNNCYIYYSAGPYYNPNTNDTIILIRYGDNYSLDTLEKYYLLGYKYINTSDDWIKVKICPEEYDRLDKAGINYNCDL